MADIKINDIKPAGAELFGDSESFMNELNDGDLMQIIGGQTDVITKETGVCSQHHCKLAAAEALFA